MNENMIREFRATVLPDDVRTRVLAACRAEAQRPRQRQLRALWLAAALLVLFSVVTLSVGAATDWFGLHSRARSHLPTAPSGAVLPQPEAVETITTADGSMLELRCNAVTGGGDLVYFDLSLARLNGTPVIPPQDGLTMTHILFEHATLTFADGLTKKLYGTVLADSTPDHLHIEGSVLLSTAELARIGQRATLALGEADLLLTGAVNNRQTQAFSETALAVEVTVGVENVTRSGTLEPIVLKGDGVTLTMTEFILNNTSLELRGSCDTDNAKLPWLEAVLDSATLTFTDGSTALCGTKSGAGSLDGGLVLHWILATTVDAAEVVSLTLNGQTVALP